MTNESRECTLLVFVWDVHTCTFCIIGGVWNLCCVCCVQESRGSSGICQADHLWPAMQPGGHFQARHHQRVDSDGEGLREGTQTGPCGAGREVRWTLVEVVHRWCAQWYAMQESMVCENWWVRLDLANRKDVRGRQCRCLFQCGVCTCTLSHYTARTAVHSFCYSNSEHKSYVLIYTCTT